jgi:hypothetical protein
MDSSKLAVKFFIQDPSGLKAEDFIPVFHHWIQSRALEGHQLIDVADYGHVQEGPGTVLISHEANIHVDLGGGRLGLLYIRKAPIPGSFRDRLRVVFGAALKAAAMLEGNTSLPAPVSFRTDIATFQINDRLLAPNSPETFARIKPDLESFLHNLYGSPVDLSYQPDPERLFEVNIRAEQSLPLATLIGQVALP